MKKKEFDFDRFKTEAISKLKACGGLTREGGAFTPLLKTFLNEALKGEMEDHFAAEKAENNLQKLKQKWGKKYPKVIESWERN